ncbi:hypothetical protein BGZ63DRAFT_377642 [Mariannaea sp. PMI_226]|nr:hypothetical protein BGZ63DRAFT_377642 [Mariannaea sp. PMI_226]
MVPFNLLFLFIRAQTQLCVKYRGLRGECFFFTMCVRLRTQLGGFFHFSMHSSTLNCATGEKSGVMVAIGGGKWHGSNLRLS